MKKVVLATFLACAVASCLPLASAQGAPSGAPADPCAAPQMAAPEYAVYNNANDTDRPEGTGCGSGTVPHAVPAVRGEGDTLETTRWLCTSRLATRPRRWMRRTVCCRSIRTTSRPALPRR